MDLNKILKTKHPQTIIEVIENISWSSQRSYDILWASVTDQPAKGVESPDEQALVETQ